MAEQTQKGETAAPAPFVLNVLWHPGCAAAPAIAEALRRHFASDRYDRIAGGACVTVLLRDASEPGSTTPPDVDWGAGEIVSVVALVDNTFAGDARWVAHLGDLAQRADVTSLATRVFPVALDAGALAGTNIQALRWHGWPERDGHGGRTGRLIRELTHEFARMLRHWLANREGQQSDQLRRYREKIQVFLSHSKHDEQGQSVAKAIRGWLHDNSALASFLDMNDMVAGVGFDEAIEDAIQHGVLVAIYTDSYSSREWCRREALLAKRHGVPMLVIDCLQVMDDRAFPYMWNVPVVRMDASQPDHADAMASALLDEVFKDYLWQQRVAQYRQGASRTVFTARPPELATAALEAGITSGAWAIVHPEPPLGQEEKRLFAGVVPNVRVSTLNEWLAGERQ